jgi:hypothetical protein
MDSPSPRPNMALMSRPWRCIWPVCICSPWHASARSWLICLEPRFPRPVCLPLVEPRASALTLVLETIKTALQSRRVIHNDETGFRVNHKRWWMHVASTCWFTLYLAHPKRGKEATEAMGILPQFSGISVHDSLASYLHYRCLHALCIVHYLRELTFIFERFEQGWAKEMKTSLLCIKACVQRAREQGLRSLPQASKQDFERRYSELVQTGLAANPPPHKPASQTRRSKEKRGAQSADPLAAVSRPDPAFLA